MLKEGQRRGKGPGTGTSSVSSANARQPGRRASCVETGEQQQNSLGTVRKSAGIQKYPTWDRHGTRGTLRTENTQAGTKVAGRASEKEKKIGLG